GPAREEHRVARGEQDVAGHEVRRGDDVRDRVQIAGPEVDVLVQGPRHRDVTGAVLPVYAPCVTPPRGLAVRHVLREPGLCTHQDLCAGDGAVRVTRRGVARRRVDVRESAGGRILRRYDVHGERRAQYRCG